jgi:histidyl-tRNA synthetase
LELNKFPQEAGTGTQVLFANFGEAEALHCLGLVRSARKAGIRAELYPDPVKLAKQFKYADDKGIPLVVALGESELRQGQVNLKDLRTGEQKAVALNEMVAALQAALGE